MHIAIIDNYDSFTYNLVHYFEALGNDVVVMMNDQIEYDLLSEADVIVLSPGPGLPLESGELMTIIDKFYFKKPILGICLGMQALALHDQMQLYNMNQVWHGLQMKIQVDTNTKLFKNCNPGIEVGLYHSWAVREVKYPWKGTAQTSDGVIMGMEHQKLLHAAVQFHPESVMTSEGLQILGNWMVNIQENHTIVD